MIEVTNTAPVTLTVNQALTFNDVVWKSGCCEAFRDPGSAVRAGQGVYKISFSGNVASAVGGTPAQLQIYVDGSPLPETVMISTPATAAIFNNVSTSTIVGNRGSCCGTPGNISISVVNTGADDITVGAGANLQVTRVA